MPIKEITNHSPKKPTMLRPVKPKASRTKESGPLVKRHNPAGYITEQLNTATTSMTELPTVYERSNSERGSPDIYLSQSDKKRRSTTSSAEFEVSTPTTPVGGWETDTSERVTKLSIHDKASPGTRKSWGAGAGPSKKLPLSKRTTSGRLTKLTSVNGPAVKTKVLHKGVENERKHLQLRFSPTKSPVKRSIYAQIPSLRRTAVRNRAALDFKRDSDEAETPLAVVSRRSGYPPSRLPVPQRYESPTQEDTFEYHMDDTYESHTRRERGSTSPELIERHDSPAPPSSPPHMLPSQTGHKTSLIPINSVVDNSQDYADRMKTEFLNALGYRKSVFDGEEEFLKEFPTMLQRLETRPLDGEIKCDLSGMKASELRIRIEIVKLNRIRSAKSNETLCLTGWEEDLKDELSKVREGTIRPHKSWIRHIVDWLWCIKEIDGKSHAQEATPAKALSENEDMEHHDFFNLADTSKELTRSGLNGMEKDVVNYWADIRGIQLVPNACGKGIIGEYIRRLTRFDGSILPEDKVQERRMHYFCVRHYAFWKTSVSQYHLALKLTNLLIVFHDLWGMHTEAMSVQEQNDWTSLHANIYSFATLFLKPCTKNEDIIWKGNECYHCFTNLAAEPLPENRDESLWLWLLQLSEIIGYGKYHAALQKIMTEGKSRDYCNDLFNNKYTMRLVSMSQGLARIQCAVRRNARIGALIRPKGTF